MKHIVLLISIALLSIAFSMRLAAEVVIPAGTILPVALNSSINSKKSKPGQVITARIMQDVPLSAGEKIPAGSKVIGHVIGASEANNGGARLSLRFDTLVTRKQRIPINTSLRALASGTTIWEAQLPMTGPDRGTSENSWTTVQVGGDEVVYRGGGPVVEGHEIVGRPTMDGVLVRVDSVSGNRCRGELDSNDRLQALWVFSSDACGAYGLPHVTIEQAGRSNPVGTIVLRSDQPELNIRGGGGMLLRVISTTTG
ncbi:MAG: hypothetical protein WA172_11840 [Terriglobales bacterium]